MVPSKIELPAILCPASPVFTALTTRHGRDVFALLSSLLLPLQGEPPTPQGLRDSLLSPASSTVLVHKKPSWNLWDEQMPVKDSDSGSGNA